MMIVNSEPSVLSNLHLSFQKYKSSNYVLATIDKNLKKIVSSPSAVNKSMQLVGKICAAYDLYVVGQIQTRPICEAMKGTTRLIGLYNLYTSIMWWVYLFSKDSLDQEAFKESLKTACQQTGMKDSETVAEEVFEKVMERKSFYSQEEVLNALREEISNILRLKEGFSVEKVDNIAKQVLIRQKARPIKTRVCSACFTISNISDGLISLNKWKILDLSRIADTIGKGSDIFSSIGLVLAFKESIKEVRIQRIKYSQAQPEEKEVAYKALRNALFSMAVGGADLIYTVAPLICNLNPGLVVGMAIISKGMGLVGFLKRS